jgi:sortase A
VTSPPEVASTPAPVTTDVPAEAPVRRQSGPSRPRAPLTAGRVAQLVGIWLLILVVCVGLVLYLVEPVFQQRTQARLMHAYQTEISHAHYSIAGLTGGQTSTAAPDLGSPVGILEIPQIHLRQAVVEGVSSEQTADGPGHVPGTAAVGQPGNSAVVGRRSTYGGSFGSLGDLHKGDRILVTTVQGQTVYKVSSVGQELITTTAPTSSQLGSSSVGGASTANEQLYRSSQKVAAAKATQSVDLEQLYGPTKANQLTLVTSSSAWPLNGSKGTVVIATMATRPFTPTAQNGRTSDQTGLTGDSSAWTGLVLALQGLALSVVGAAFLYRRFGMRVAYLLTTPPLIVFVILIAEASSRLLPAWT